MTDLAVRTAVRDMLDRSADRVAARATADALAPTDAALDGAALDGAPLGDRSALPAEAVLVDLTSPPRRTRRVLAAALVAVAAVGGALALAGAPGSEGTTERVGPAQAPPSAPLVEDGGEGTTPAAADPATRLTLAGDKLTLQVLGDDAMLESPAVVGIGAADTPGPATELLDVLAIVRVRLATEGGAEPGTADAWGGAVHLASGEPVALYGSGAERTVVIDAGDVTVEFEVSDPAFPADDLATLMAGVRIERVD